MIRTNKRAQLDAALDRIARLESALRCCAERFRDYEAHHNANTSSGALLFRKRAKAKAERNRMMAEMCDAALRGP